LYKILNNKLQHMNNTENNWGVLVGEVWVNDYPMSEKEADDLAETYIAAGRNDVYVVNLDTEEDI